MSQVISIRVPEHYEDACAAFQKEVDLDAVNDFVERGFMFFYDESIYEIRCEGLIPDSIFSALVKVKGQFDGKLFYEGQEWNDLECELVEKAGLLEKIWIVLAVLFFPITIIYFLLRVFIWVPFKIWKSTR